MKISETTPFLRIVKIVSPSVFFKKKSTPPANTTILQGPEAAPQAVRETLRTGLQYRLNDRWVHFSWKTTEADLAQIPGFSHETGIYGWNVWRLNAPVRLAGLELEHRLEINDSSISPHANIRTDVPLSYYSFYTAFGGDGTSNYRTLKAHCVSLFGSPSGGWERADQLCSEWRFEGLKFACIWTNPRTISRVNRTFDEYASLSIWNDILYPEYLTDAYTNTLQTDAAGFSIAFFFPKMLQLSDNYRSNRSVRLTPAPVARALEQSGKTLAVWLDPSRDRIGLARSERALVLPTTSIQQLNFCTIDCDRHYEDRLYAILKSGEEVLLLYAAEGDLARLKQWLVEHSGLPVTDLGFQR